MRYLGLDVGKKEIGLAVGEAIASEHSTIRAPKNSDFYSNSGQKLAFEQIKKVMTAEQANAIVVGLPVDEEGRPTEESAKIRSWSDNLATAISAEVHFVDETLTSFMAADMLESQGANADEVERRVHQLSAELILQQFLESGDEDL